MVSNLSSFDSGLDLHGLQFQSHYKQRTLFDHFVVIRQPTPAPTFAEPEGPSHDEPESQTEVEHTGTECSPSASHLPELPSGEQPDDKVHTTSSPLGSRQSTAGIDIGARALH